MDSELGEIYEKCGFKGKDELKSTENEWQNINEHHPDHERFEAKLDKPKVKTNVKTRATRCWDCGTEISTSVDGSCSKCNTGIPCNFCGSCICERPEGEE